MSKSQCKCAEVECEECPEWIFTLADLIMCMMGLFVILWVLKPAGGKSGEAQALPVEMVAAIREAFGYQPDPQSTDPVDIHMLMERLKQLRAIGPGEKGTSRNEIKGAEGTDPEVTSVRNGAQAVVGGRLLFERGSADLGGPMQDVLNQIADRVRGHRTIVLVKGHTSLDDLGSEASAEQKMHLSIQRAQAVADYLVARGVEPDILRVQGCSVFEPVAQRKYTSNAQAQNRRVEVESTSTLVQERQDPSAVVPATTPAENVQR